MDQKLQLKIYLHYSIANEAKHPPRGEEPNPSFGPGFGELKQNTSPHAIFSFFRQSSGAVTDF